MNKYLVADAISYLDADLLTEHLKKKEKLKNRSNSGKKTSILKWSGIAACLCVVVVIGIILIPMMQNLWTEGGTENFYSLGKTVENEYGALTLVDRDFDNKTCTFTFVKKTDDHICFKFGGAIIKEQYTDENGETHQKIQAVDVVSNSEGYIPEDGHKVMDVALKIKVNGNDVETIPTVPGEYEIVIDYSSLYDSLYRVDNVVKVIGFGNFHLDNFD